MPAAYRYRPQDQSRAVKHTRLENESEIENQYILSGQLGKGSFGTVLEATRKTDSLKWAVKIINKEKAGSAAVKLLEREVVIMKKVKHKHIIHLEEVLETAKKMFLVMELCKLGGLEELLIRKRHFNEQEGLCIFQQLADAVSYIHQNDIIHRDLKLDNILLAEPLNSSLYNIKLTDFGLSYTRGGSGSDYMMNQVVGTPIYMAPEVITNYGYSQQCDIWSVGVILYKLLSGDAPFMASNEDDLYELIKKGNVKFPQAKWKDIAQSAIHLIEGMLKVDPAHRLTSKEVLQHPWLRGEVNASGTTNVLEMMKQYNLEQKQLAEKERSDKLKEIESTISMMSSASEPDGLDQPCTSGVTQSVSKSTSSSSIGSSKGLDKDKNNNSKDTPKLSKKTPASKTQSMPAYMQSTRSSRAPRNPNNKVPIKKRNDPNS